MIQVGDTFKHTFSYTQDDVNTYARVSGDTNPLHIDEAAGKASMFGRCIIHGYLGGSVFTKLFGTTVYADGNVYMKQLMQFMRPMFTGVNYEAVITVAEIFPEKNRVLYKTEVFNVDTKELTITGEALLMNKKQYVW
ncbi:MAG: MaoC family dehydratase [Bacteroidia bacterium]|nr:MaoC family dehydratase [Bacteroidia bacterium]HQV01117.1 MaoC family dehydratase [Bacteroidia bacterium]